MNELAIKDLLYKLADDQLILGHRNSEWTGFGPILEEDIAFSSMAQDKIGHSLAFYTLLQELGEADPDTVAFTRNANQFHNSQLVELPNGEYDFSLIRHFLYDNAEIIRFEMLSQSSYEPIAKVATKLKGEVKYHVLHANTWIKNLGSSTEEAILRLQSSLNEALPYALAMFENSKYEQELIDAGVYAGEEAVKTEWLKRIQAVIDKTDLKLPDLATIEPKFGGRYGEHTEHLQPLLDEMAEVFKIDPTAEW
ncbi:phenylacetate-CoA oxygenase subunit PaaC [Pontibacter sp. BT310]|uniref:Phenylacetate-CoA oxygenase subunit PaaC n=1 Tax=Pontibacter populi TaxID=890055 RepID=A0ABS6XBP5_9BACT|nr:MULTISPECIES: 1,2-phenylacetyl-CoA epoxidase subunit PaaC [Pontibacter]MBJ6118560.1 phenylacetate-CoA oxygenase subunit PaaC [Pontibacter sp. BT310]MBR0570989.1 phenylacetate-CoA oxygenase subunit PaaC [Microvirga sp. STS03]MBW3365414.1 phenylacetate-CoA oxygenase subunit PaaC [Pontibacter populi]